jgi:hypothetical protein
VGAAEVGAGKALVVVFYVLESDAHTWLGCEINLQNEAKTGEKTSIEDF